MQDRRVATLFLMVGLPGAGKPTRAKELAAARRALRLETSLGLDFVARQPAWRERGSAAAEFVLVTPFLDLLLLLAVAAGRLVRARLQAFLLAALHLAAGTPDIAGLSADAFASQVRAPYSRMTQRLEAVRTALVSDLEEALDAAIRDVEMLLKGKGLTSWQRRDAIARAMAGTGMES
jgi:hypothetical protein